MSVASPARLLPSINILMISSSEMFRVLQSSHATRDRVVLRFASRHWLAQKSQRIVHSTFAVRHSAGSKSHLDPAQRSAQGQIVEKAEVANAKHAAQETPKPHAERQVVAREHLAP